MMQEKERRAHRGKFARQTSGKTTRMLTRWTTKAQLALMLPFFAGMAAVLIMEVHGV